jgi:hypothetical protein
VIVNVPSCTSRGSSRFARRDSQIVHVPRQPGERKIVGALDHRHDESPVEATPMPTLICFAVDDLAAAHRGR